MNFEQGFGDSRRRRDQLNARSQNLSGERGADTSQRQNNHSHSVNSRKVPSKPRRDEGASLSSAFSSASGRAGHLNDTSARDAQGRHQGSDSIAQQLSRTYFLNTKQLLRHLSPSKEPTKSELAAQEPSKAANITTHVDNEVFFVEKSYRNSTVRGRSKSTTHNFHSMANAAEKKRNNSQSTTSRTRGQPRNKEAMSSIMAKPVAPAQPTAETLEQQRVLKSKSATLGAAAPGPAPSAGYASSLGAAGKQAKHNLDKLIKQNIRKNQSRIEEQQLRQQLEEFRQQQRKNNLSQRNKELRQINASKIVGTTNKESTQAPSTLAGPLNAKYNVNVSLDKQTAPSALTMKPNQDRKRSQSCVDYKSIKGKTMDSDRQPARSQERSEEAEAAAELARLQMQRPTKAVPQTTTN